MGKRKASSSFWEKAVGKCKKVVAAVGFEPTTYGL